MFSLNDGISIASSFPKNKKNKIFIKNDSDSEDSYEHPFSIFEVLESLKKGQQICPLCKKKYSTKDNLRRHIGISCPVGKSLQIGSSFGGTERNSVFTISSLGTVKTNNRKIKLFPTIPTEKRDCIFVFGPSGAGKSTWASNYIKRFNKKFPNESVVLFSFIQDDPAFRDIENLRQITLDESIINDPIELNELKNSLVIFDDITGDNDIAIAMHSLRDDILTKGRHENIYSLSTTHMSSNWNETRILKSESNKVVFFPRGPQKQIKEFLSGIGLEKSQIEKILRIKSRWIMVNQTFPVHCLYEHGALML